MKKRGTKWAAVCRESHTIGFLAPFRAHRATAASDIGHHVAVDDLRRSLAAAARKMSVYVWTVSGGNRAVGREIWGLPSHHGVNTRGGKGRGRDWRPRRPYPAVAEFVGAVAPLAAGSSPVGRPRPRWGSAGLRSAGRLIVADLGLGMLISIKTKTL